MADEAAIGEKFRALAGELNERQRRLWAASEARVAGRGGIAATARATGISVPTIRKGIAELQAGERLEPGRVRRPGGGRKPLTEVDRSLVKDLERLVDADSRGDPESLLRWTSKSVRHLAEGLRELGHQAHFTTVAQLLRGLGYMGMSRGSGRVMQSIVSVLRADSSDRWFGIDELASRTYGTPNLTRAQRVAVARAVRRLDEMGAAHTEWAEGDSWPPRVAVREPGRPPIAPYITEPADSATGPRSGPLNVLDDPARAPAILRRVEGVLGGRASRVLQMHLQGRAVDEIADQMGLMPGVVDETLRVVLDVLPRMRP